MLLISPLMIHLIVPRGGGGGFSHGKFEVLSVVDRGKPAERHLCYSENQSVHTTDFILNSAGFCQGNNVWNLWGRLILR